MTLPNQRLEVLTQAFTAVVLAAAVGYNALAQPVTSPVEATEWHVEGRLAGKDDKKAEDVSGVSCSTLPPHDCLVIDDETQSAQWVTIEDGEIRAGGSVPLIDDKLPDGTPVELDGEAAAYGDGSFFVIGSFGSARRPDEVADPEGTARLKADSHVFRITPSAGSPTVEESSALRDLVLAEPDLKLFFDMRLELGGLTVEGLAVVGDTSFVGFRGPLLDSATKAAVLQVPTAKLFGNADGQATLRRLPLGLGRGVRDLSVVGDELLVLAGPMADTDAANSAANAYSIFRWDPHKPDPQSVDEMMLLVDLPGFKHGANNNKPDKPEAIVPLAVGDGVLKLLVLFDGPKEGAPRSLPVTWLE